MPNKYSRQKKFGWWIWDWNYNTEAGRDAYYAYSNLLLFSCIDSTFKAEAKTAWDIAGYQVQILGSSPYDDLLTWEEKDTVQYLDDLYVRKITFPSLLSELVPVDNMVYLYVNTILGGGQYLWEGGSNKWCDQRRRVKFWPTYRYAA